MNLFHILCLAGVFVSSLVMAATVIMFAPMTRLSILLIRLAGCSAVLSMVALWVGLICKLIVSTIN